MGGLGQWTYPDGSVVLSNGPSATAGQQFYINRSSAQVIGLNRRDANNPLTPTGSYCCTVPTTEGEMTLCANLGEWIIIALLLCFMSASMCVHVHLHKFLKPSQLSHQFHYPHNLCPLLQLHLLQSHVLIISRLYLMEP